MYLIITTSPGNAPHLTFSEGSLEEAREIYLKTCQVELSKYVDSIYLFETGQGEPIHSVYYSDGGAYNPVHASNYDLRDEALRDTQSFRDFILG